MRRRDITVERMRELFTYDPLTGRLCQQASGKVGFVPGSEVGHVHPNGYAYVSVDRLKVPCHRAAWALHYGQWPEGDIDHINRDKADNRIDNLRTATISQNQVNVIKPNATGRKGVRMCKGKFQAQIKHNGRNMHLGTFATLDEAAHAYNKAAIFHHGEFAVLNPVGQDRCGAQGAGDL